MPDAAIERWELHDFPTGHEFTVDEVKNVLVHRTWVHGVYAFCFGDTGKFYVGSSQSVLHRWRQHINSMRRGVHDLPAVQAAYREHGEECLRFYILEKTDRYGHRTRENQLINQMRPTLNPPSEYTKRIGKKNGDGVPLLNPRVLAQFYQTSDGKIRKRPVPKGGSR